jgi:hypothetical protein
MKFSCLDDLFLFYLKISPFQIKAMLPDPLEIVLPPAVAEGQSA